MFYKVQKIKHSPLEIDFNLYAKNYYSIGYFSNREKVNLFNYPLNRPDKMNHFSQIINTHI